MKVNIGKNTLGDPGKMTLNLREYGRSTHNLSYAWRSTMGVGGLTPFMKILALPGDTFNIDLENKILTSPTIGPLFGSFKFQADIFTCPIRLYNAMLHNNTLNIGLDMSKVKLPTINYKRKVNQNTSLFGGLSTSNILNYLELRSQDASIGEELNAVPLLAYYDIFKNYYANKQEKKFPMYTSVIINNNDTTLEGAVVLKENPTTGVNMPYLQVTANKEFREIDSDTKIGIYNVNNKLFITTLKSMPWDPNVEGTTNNIRYYRKGKGARLLMEDVAYSYLSIPIGGELTDQVKNENSTTATFEQGESARKIELFDLSEIDDLREFLLSKGKQAVNFNYDNTRIPFLKSMLNDKTVIEDLGGMCLKTYQSDLFTNFINQEWIEGDNGISKITAIDTSEGSFTLDTLNLSKKVYEMLNRIAISGGTYKDWIETVYTTDYYFRAETPIYEGGMSSEIEFEAVTSLSASDVDNYEPLGTLAGRGVNTSKKGGKITIKVNEPCYIIGIASITPRVDYSMNKPFDVDLQTLNDLHKPQLDGIGYQDLLEKRACFRADGKKAYGKQPAWLDYTTNYNKTFGKFAYGESQSYMVLNRPIYYSQKEGKVKGLSSYIEPEKFNNIFATTGTQEQNFWVQIGCGIEARRVMSARQIPNF